MTGPSSWPRSRLWRRSIRNNRGALGRALHGIADLLAIVGGVLCCLMAAIVTVSVGGRYLFARPVPGDYDLVGILCGCAIFSFLPYCQLKGGNVLADFFTQAAPPRFKAALDAGGNVLFLAAAIMFTWRLCYGLLEMRRSAEQIAAFSFYRWWTMPFDIFCMLVLIGALLQTLGRGSASAR
ncbi:MAG: TRAP transporter small permease [Candidatus Rokuibacteriota bacterium]|nr:MAG: TRAP transporter small permease [Candidatus Rokubacteria bacterium]